MGSRTYSQTSQANLKAKPLLGSRGFAICTQFSSGRVCPIDVLVKSARTRTGIWTDCSSRGIHRATLQHIRTVVIGVAALPSIQTGHRVAVIRPGAVREVAVRRDPEVIAVERHSSAVKLLIVRIAREVGNPRGASPRVAQIV